MVATGEHQNLVNAVNAIYGMKSARDLSVSDARFVNAAL